MATVFFTTTNKLRNAGILISIFCKSLICIEIYYLNSFGKWQ